MSDEVYFQNLRWDDPAESIEVIHLLTEVDSDGDITNWRILDDQACEEGEFFFARGHCWAIRSEDVLALFHLDGEVENRDGDRFPTRDWFVVIRSR